MTRTTYICESLERAMNKVYKPANEKEYRRELRRVYSLLHRLTQV